MSSSIAYDSKPGVDRAGDDNIIEFLDRIYIGLRRWCHLKDGDDFLKERLTILRIVKSYKLVSLKKALIFAYMF